MCVRSVRSILIGGAVALAVSPAGISAHAAPPRINLPGTSVDDLTGDNVAAANADECFNRATNLLQNGRRFEDAIMYLKRAISLSPHSSAYESALGCALASRAASVACAGRNVGQFYLDQAIYRRLYAAWLTAHKDDQSRPTEPDGDEPADDSPELQRMAATLSDPAAQYYQNYLPITADSPAPVPPLLTTKDDDRPFTLTDRQAAGEVRDLGRKATAAFDSSISDATTSDEHTQCEWTRCYGQRLLFDSANYLGVAPPVSLDGVIAGFRALAHENPRNPIYWQALGDTLFSENPRASDHSEGIAAYDRAFQLDPGNTPLRFWEFTAILDDKREPTKGDRRTVLAMIRYVHDHDSSNAYTAYYLASYLLCDHPADMSGTPAAPPLHIDAPRVRDAIALLDQSALASSCRPLPYAEHGPAWLTQAWGYLGYGQAPTSYLPFPFIGLADAICKSATTHADRMNDAQTAMAVRALRGVLDISKNIDKSLPADDATWQFEDRSLFKIACDIAVSGYAALVKFYADRRDADGLRQAFAERDSVLRASDHTLWDIVAADKMHYGKY